MSRLHVELGHSDPRGMIDSLRRKHAHRLIIVVAKKSSVAVHVKKVRDEDYVQWLLEFFMNLAHVFKLTKSSGRHPVLNLHVLGTFIVDAGSRAASVTIHRVMDVEHGLGNVTSEIMLATLLNHWVKYYGKPDIVRTDPEGAFSRSRISTWFGSQEHTSSTLILGKRQEFLGKPLTQSNSQHFVWLEELLTMSQFKKSLMNALQHTMTLHRNRGFSPWQLLLGKTPTDETACEDPDLAQCSVELVDEAARQRLRVKVRVVQSVHRGGAVTSKTSQRDSSSPTLETLGSR